MRWQSTLAAALVASLGLAAAGCTPESDPTKNRDIPPSSVEVEEGTDARAASPDGRLTVEISGQSIAGSGRLSITALKGEPVTGWSIDLDGAQLSGPATLSFTAATPDKSAPAPLVAYQVDGTDEVVPVADVHLNGTVAQVTTTHFSNWFTLWWQDLLGAQRAKMDDFYSADAFGRDPSCDYENEVRTAGYSVTSDSGSRVKWCLGQAADGSPALKVVNARGYAVAVESTPGAVLGAAETEDALEQLSEWVRPDPSLPQNAVTIASSGQELTFAITSAGGGSAAVRVQPSVGAFLVTAAQYAMDTMVFIAGFAGKELSRSALVTALAAESCWVGYSSMMNSGITTPTDAGNYLIDALGTTLGCAEAAFKRLDIGGVASVIASGVAWFATGLRAAMNGIGAAADSALDPSGYQITVTVPPPAAIREIALPAGQDGLFSVESGDLVCRMGDGEVRCDPHFSLALPLPPRPAWCDLEWGPAVSMSSWARVACVGDTVGVASPGENATQWFDSDRDLLVGSWNGEQQVALRAGSTMVSGELACTAEADAVECANSRTQAAMRLSPDAFDVTPPQQGPADPTTGISDYFASWRARDWSALDAMAGPENRPTDADGDPVVPTDAEPQCTSETPDLSECITDVTTLDGQLAELSWLVRVEPSNEGRRAFVYTTGPMGFG